MYHHTQLVPQNLQKRIVTKNTLSIILRASTIRSRKVKFEVFPKNVQCSEKFGEILRTLLETINLNLRFQNANIITTTKRSFNSLHTSMEISKKMVLCANGFFSQIHWSINTQCCNESRTWNLDPKVFLPIF